jgi:hypothetical protein
VDDSGPGAARSSASAAAHGQPGQSGVIGIALAAVLTAALAQGSWQWFATYVGVTLLAVVFSFYRSPNSTPGPGSPYLRGLAAYSLVVGLCVAITLAPMLQRWSWLFPMPGTRAGCPALSRYEALRTQAALGSLAGRDSSALTEALRSHSHDVLADCLSATTTLWLPVYGAGAAVLVGLGTWYFDRTRRDRSAPPAGA